LANRKPTPRKAASRSPRRSRALIGKKKGASVEVVAPGGAKAYEITKVDWK
jgi:transcription elongation GreA/GreB family factor